MTETNPPTEPEGAPPTGSVTDTATCCPLVSTFDASPQTGRTTGYDHRTNLAQTEGQGEYWLPPAKAKVVPDDPYKQDGSGWASVRLGGTTELEVSFEGQSGDGCIVNCTFECLTEGVVTISTPKVGTNGAAFRIKGIGEGETTIRVLCDGAELGWVHIVCYRPITLTIALVNVISEVTRPAIYDAGRISFFLRQAFGPAGLDFEVVDYGEIDFNGWDNYSFDPKLCQVKLEQPKFIDGFGTLPAGTDIISPDCPLGPDNDLAYRLPQLFVNQTDAMLELGNQITVYFYVPAAGFTPQQSGSSDGIGADSIFVYKDFNGLPAPYGPDYAYATIAHEVGHALGLEHPGAKSNTQLPSHLLASINKPVSPQSETNAEIAVTPENCPAPVADFTSNIMARDPLNLMGYWPAFPEAMYLRKGQWDAARAFATRMGEAK